MVVRMKLLFNPKCRLINNHGIVAAYIQHALLRSSFNTIL